MVVRREDLYEPSEISAQKKTNEILSEIEEKTIDGKKLFELFVYDDVSLWWFIFPTIYISVKEAVSFIDSFQEILKGKNLREIHVVGDFGKLHLIEQVGKKHNIEVKHPYVPYLRFQAKKWLTRQVQPSRYRRITQNKMQSRMKILQNSKDSTPSIKDRVVFAVASAYRRKIYDAEVKDVKTSEFLVGPVIDIVKKLKHEIVGIDLDYTFKGQNESLSRRLKDDFPWFPIEAIIKNYHKTGKQDNFLKKYDSLMKDRDIQSAFVHNGINFWTYVEEDFLTLSYFPYLPTYLKLIDSCKQYFNENKPAAVFLPYEAGPIALPIIIACQQSGVRTIGFQHGLIYGINPDYSHHNFRTKNDPMGMPLPDNLLLFGNYAKNKLIEMKTYPQEKLIVFGHPMYFNITKVKETLGSQDIKGKYGIPKDKKIILFTTGRFQKHYRGFETRNHDEKILERLLEEFGGKNEYFVILKPHPTEDYVDSYQKMISDSKSANFRIIQSDLFELLFVADVVTCYFSTILLDSIAFGKFAIEVDFGEKISTIPFKEFNVVLNSDLSSLKQSIERLLHEEALQEMLRKNMDSFIKEHFNIPNNSAEEQIKLLTEGDL